MFSHTGMGDGFTSSFTSAFCFGAMQRARTLGFINNVSYRQALMTLENLKLGYDKSLHALILMIKYRKNVPLSINKSIALFSLILASNLIL